MLEQQDNKGSRFIGKQARVETKNRRRFQGKIMCIDYKGNLILHEAVAQIPPEHNCPLNYQLANYADSKLSFTPSASLTQQQKQQAMKEYIGSHYYFGSIMVAGHDIARLELSTLPQAEKSTPQESKKSQMIK